MKISRKHFPSAFCSLFLLLAGHCCAQVIDFESVSGSASVDDTVISDQFRASHGVRFRLDTDGDGLPDADLPRIEAAGLDGTDAFVGGGSRDVADPAFTARLGNFFLRSHLAGDGGTRAPLALIVLYDTPVSGASGEIWDIDGTTSTEQWQIDALGPRYASANDVTDIVDSTLSPLGNTHLLNAKPWTFSFDHRGTKDIHALRIQFVGTKTGGIGLAFDNFSTNLPEPDVCGTGLPPIRSSSYENSATSSVQFAHQPQFNATVATTIEAWVYRNGPDTRCETIVAQDFTSDLWFGLCPNPRFYRSGGTQATASASVPAKRWTHVAVSYNGLTARFYINGEPAGTEALSNTGAGGSLPLFLGGEAGGIPFDGCLDEVRIWSIVRSQAQIRNGMHEEIRSAPGLAAVFPEGGMNETISGLRGTSTSPPEEKVWGMLPNYLVVPRVSKTVLTFDGQPVAETEYRGAEEIPIRYDAGPDGRALLVYTDEDGESDDKLYVGLTGLREIPGGPSRSLAQVGIFLDPDRSRSTHPGSRDFRFSSSMAGVNSRAIFGDGSGDWRLANGIDEGFLANSYDIQDAPGANNEFGTPTFEFKIGKPLLGDFTGPKGFGVGHFNAEHLFDIDNTPEFVVQNEPATWTCLTFGDDADRPSAHPSIRISVTDQAGTGLGGYQFWIRDAVTGEIYVDLETGSGGSSWVTPSLPADRPLRIQIPSCSGCTHLDPMIGAGGLAPTSTSSLQVDFPPLGAGFVGSLADVTFVLEQALGPLVFDAIAEPTAIVPTVMRTVPDKKVVPTETRITLLGQNFRAGYEVYLYNCRDLPPIPSSSCQEGVHYIRCAVPEVDPVSADRTRMTVLIPEDAPIGQWDIAVRGNGLTPAEQWKRQGPIILTQPNYAKIYGFEFENEPDDREFDGTRWKLFTAVYGDNVFGRTCVPKPMYLLWSVVFGFADRGINGTCVGFASTSRLFAMGDLHATDFDANYPFGIPGVAAPVPWNLARLIPTQPDRYARRSGLCNGYRPRNLWGEMRTNHLVQLSDQVLQDLIDQATGTIEEGGPRAVYQRLASLPGAYLLSMQRPGGAHCVTPLRVHEGFQASRDSNSLVEDRSPVAGDPGTTRYRAIEIYDNNFPGRSRFVGVDWQRNIFFYDRGLNSTGEARRDYTGDTIYTLPISIWQNSRTRPKLLRGGIEAVYHLLMGDAMVEHEDANGNVWGWDEAGSFQENYPGSLSHFLLDGGPEDHRAALFLPPAGTVPERTHIHGTGGDYTYHADQGNVMVQVHATGTAGNSDAVNLHTNANGLCGLRIVPQAASTGMRVCLGAEFSQDQSATFDLSEMTLDPKKGLSLELLEGELGVAVRNEGTNPVTYRLKMNAADDAVGVSNNQSFGTITVPAGASQSLALTDWPRNQSIRVTNDLDGDGAPDTTVFVAALPAPQLNLIRTGSQLDISWAHQLGRILMTSSNLEDWTPVSGIVIDGNVGNFSTSIPAGGGEHYYQLWE